MGQETKQEKGIVISNAAEIRTQRLEKIGAEKTLVQYLIDERQGSIRFSLRLYTVQKDGHTPLDEHVHEHQVYILRGQGQLRQSRDVNAPLKALKTGDSIFIPSNAIHQFSNTHDEPFVFLCVKGNPQLYSCDPESSKPDVSEKNYC